MDLCLRDNQTNVNIERILKEKFVKKRKFLKQNEKFPAHAMSSLGVAWSQFARGRPLHSPGSNGAPMGLVRGPGHGPGRRRNAAP